MNSSAEFVVHLIVRVKGAPAGVSFAVQRGRADMLLPFEMTGGVPTFAFTLRVGPAKGDRPYNFLGEFAQGPADDRFVYVNSGKRAGQWLSNWDRRAKLKLATIPEELVRAAREGSGRVLVATMRGVAKDGGPICATVPADAVEWSLDGAEV
jgi:hypothetical protein